MVTEEREHLHEQPRHKNLSRSSITGNSSNLQRYSTHIKAQIPDCAGKNILNRLVLAT